MRTHVVIHKDNTWSWDVFNVAELINIPVFILHRNIKDVRGCCSCASFLRI